MGLNADEMAVGTEHIWPPAIMNSVSRHSHRRGLISPAASAAAYRGARPLFTTQRLSKALADIEVEQNGGRPDRGTRAGIRYTVH